MDRLIQQAICQVLTPIFEKQFSENSFGFRPKRTGLSNGMGIEERRIRLNQLIRGWVNYFKLADMKKLLKELDEWTRSRIRMVIWKRWKKVRTRYENLKRLGLVEERAWMWANTRKGYWRVAHSPILTRALSNERLKRAGYLSFVAYYSACNV